MAKKIQLQDANGNVLHPLTLGECVTMDNGENLDTLMSKSQMFTPTITQDKSMFKVGTGIDVDYSANVKDGAYESLVFKGKSLVNLMTSCKDETLIQYYNPPADSNVANVSMIKPNTVYTIIYSVKYREEGNTGHLIVRTQQDGGDINVSSGFTFGTTYKRFAYKFTTPSTIDYFVLRSNGHYFHVKEVMLLEGDYTNVNIPYFEGICDSKMPILRNVGKNLFDPTLHKGLTKRGGYYSVDITQVGDTFVEYKVEPNTQYTLKFDKYGTSSCWIGVTIDGAYNNNNNTHYSKTFTTNNTGKTTIRIGANGTSDLGHTIANIMLCKTNDGTTYEDHKTNILRTSEEIVLRSLPNGVCDTYNARTGEYVKRIGERTLNGSEAWIANSGTDKRFEDVWVFHNQESLCNGTVRLCDKLQARENANENAEFIRGGGAYIFVYISKNKVQNHNANDFKTWLQSNPITVQYELAEPVTTIVKPSTTTPFAYQNGHVIVESGFEGQSLLPEIEYSVVTGRTGQVTQNTKVLRKQEQQIISLEELLLTQIVQMEYERTLLQFDYELQMMMLG